MNLFWNDPFSLFDIMHGSVYLCSDLAVELPFMLTHPKPEEPEPIPTPAQRDGTQDGAGKFLTCCLSGRTSNVSRQRLMVLTTKLIKYSFVLNQRCANQELGHAKHLVYYNEVE